jgi:hypothetical protein
MGIMSTSSYVWKCPCGGESGFTLSIFSPHCEKCGKTPNDFAICADCGKIFTASEIEDGREPKSALSPWRGVCHECSKRKLINTVKETFQKISSRGWASCKLCNFIAKGSSFGDILETLGRHWEWHSKKLN